MIRELLARAARMGAEKVMEDPRGQEAVARAVGAAQKGFRLFGAVQERALHLAGLAGRSDHEQLRKQIARIKRKARELGEKLDSDEGSGGR